MFVSSVLLNVEAWGNITKKNIDDLEKLDNILLRNIFNASSSTPVVFCHLELKTLPLRYLIQSRRLSFLQYILQQNPDSMIYQVLFSQIESPLQGDMWLSAKNDLKSLNMNLTLHDIKSLSKYQFKKLVKNAVHNHAFIWLNEQKNTLNKIKHISYDIFKMQDYLQTDKLTIHDKKFLFAARGRGLFLRCNYPNRYVNSDLFCCLCFVTNTIPQLDEQRHLLLCEELRDSNVIIETNRKYEDIFSFDINIQTNMAMLLRIKYEKRKQLELNLTRQI